MADRTNVLVICVDEMRADHMACAGHPMVKTPNLDRLAARGTRFSRSYCNNPICMPARTSMFTGLLPRDHGVRVNGQSPQRDLPVLPELFRRAGYRTHAAGKLHLTPYVPKVSPADPARFPEDLEGWNRGEIRRFPRPYFGFESVDFVGGHTGFVFGEYIQWLKDRGGDPALLRPAAGLEPACHAPNCFRMALPKELHYNRYVTDSTIDLIDSHAADRERPFFAFCSIPDPHMPVAPPRPYDTMYDPAKVPLPARREGELDDLPAVYRRVLSGEVRPNGVNSAGVSDDDWRQILALTFGMITHLDDELGRVFDALDRHGLWENTVVVFVSDHGDMMGDHGLLWKAFYTFEGCIRIPTIVAAPGMPGGRESGALISQVDLMPSLLDLAGLEMPGRDWESIETPYERGSVQALNPYPGRSWQGLLDGSAATIRDSVVIENDDPTTGLQPRCLVTERYRMTVYGGQTWGELFDLQEDPQELHNRWDDPAFATVRAQLSERLLNEYAAQTAWHPVPAWNA